MCDCYSAKCKNCTKTFDIHLGDYNTGRNEIEVFCEKHLPKENVRIFKVSKTPKKYVKMDWGNITQDFLMGIRSLTENARANEHHNYPNNMKYKQTERRE